MSLQKWLIMSQPKASSLYKTLSGQFVIDNTGLKVLVIH